MMIPINGPGGARSVFSASTPAAPGANTAQGTQKSSQFDKLNISKDDSQESQFQRTLVSRLVQEVRCANTTGDIQKIKESVQNGTYRPDASETASKLLLEGALHEHESL